MEHWWKTFFDSDYARLWGGRRLNSEETTAQAQGIWELLSLHAGSRVLDAPCGYGRLSVPIAKLGAVVLGVDQSEEMLAYAERHRDGLPNEQLRYLRHDLREPLAEKGFDAAFNVFTSIGYGTEKDDLAVFTTLHSAVCPGGLVFIETMHRDRFVALRARGGNPSQRMGGWHADRGGAQTRPDCRPHGFDMVMVWPIRTRTEVRFHPHVYRNRIDSFTGIGRLTVPFCSSRMLKGGVQG
jgi:SAM-dependent methyltransferase